MVNSDKRDVEHLSTHVQPTIWLVELLLWPIPAAQKIVSMHTTFTTDAGFRHAHFATWFGGTVLGVLLLVSLATCFMTSSTSAIVCCIGIAAAYFGLRWCILQALDGTFEI